MPFDGTKYEQQQDEVLALLRRARERVSKGWCQGPSRDGDKFCAWGAVHHDSASADYRLAGAAINDLYRALPWWRKLGSGYTRDGAVIFYNEMPWRRHKAIIALFDRAIARRERETRGC